MGELTYLTAMVSELEKLSSAVKLALSPGRVLTGIESRALQGGKAVARRAVERTPSLLGLGKNTAPMERQVERAARNTLPTMRDLADASAIICTCALLRWVKSFLKLAGKTTASLIFPS